MPVWLIRAKCGVGKKIFQYSLHPRGTSALYLEVGTFSRSIASTQLTLDRLHCSGYFLSVNQRCCYYVRWGKRVWRHTSISQISYGIGQRRNTIFPVPSLWQFPAGSCFTSGSAHPDWGRIRQSPCLCLYRRWVRLSSCQYPDGRVRVSPFSLTWMGSQSSRAQLECQLIQETQEWAERCEHKQAKQARRHAGGHRLSTKTNATLQEVLSRWVQWRPFSYCSGAFPWWCLSAILVRPQPWLLNRTMTSPSYLSLAPLCLSLSLMTCQFQVHLGDIPSASVFFARPLPGRHYLVRMSFCWSSHSSKRKLGPLSQWFTQLSSW